MRPELDFTLDSAVGRRRVGCCGRVWVTSLKECDGRCHDLIWPRAPEAPLQFFLAQEFPLAPVFDAMRQLRENAAKAAGGSVTEALARRDEVLLGLLASNL
jgi:hypothetical protein